jgi:hypothetical protein
MKLTFKPILYYQLITSSRSEVHKLITCTYSRWISVENTSYFLFSLKIYYFKFKLVVLNRLEWLDISVSISFRNIKHMTKISITIILFPLLYLFMINWYVLDSSLLDVFGHAQTKSNSLFIQQEPVEEVSFCNKVGRFTTFCFLL